MYWFHENENLKDITKTWIWLQIDNVKGILLFSFIVYPVCHATSLKWSSPQNIDDLIKPKITYANYFNVADFILVWNMFLLKYCEIYVLKVELRCLLSRVSAIHAYLSITYPSESKAAYSNNIDLSSIEMTNESWKAV